MSDFWARRLLYNIYEEPTLNRTEVKIEVNRDAFIKLIKMVPLYT